MSTEDIVVRVQIDPEGKIAHYTSEHTTREAQVVRLGNGGYQLNFMDETGDHGDGPADRWHRRAYDWVRWGKK